ARRSPSGASRGVGGLPCRAFWPCETFEAIAAGPMTKSRFRIARMARFTPGSGWYNEFGRRIFWEKTPMNRRELLKATAALPLLQALRPSASLAQDGWPARTISMIVPFPAGGQADLAARPVGVALEKVLGKSVIVDNRAGGAGGAIGNAAAARAEPDGYTLLMTLSSLAVLPEADRLFGRPVAFEVLAFAPIPRV